jgi:hypothetical protein
MFRYTLYRYMTCLCMICVLAFLSVFSVRRVSRCARLAPVTRWSFLDQHLTNRTSTTLTPHTRRCIATWSSKIKTCIHYVAMAIHDPHYITVLVVDYSWDCWRVVPTFGKAVSDIWINHCSWFDDFLFVSGQGHLW